MVPWFAEPLFGSRSSVRTFPGWNAQAVAFAPAAIAATRTQFLTLAGTPPRLTHAVIVLARPHDMLLTVADRDTLWRAFRVPIFEQLIGSNGERLASECEAHDGLHVASLTGDWTGFALDEGQCACGLRTPRVSSPERVERVRAAAMFAR